ncbi:MAG: periplasmic heavy metal sensor [Elusimicrobia bacterium]|nr:periplasmic heavy metal sensor [Elusimicrobiota bacterium]
MMTRLSVLAALSLCLVPAANAQPGSGEGDSMKGPRPPSFEMMKEKVGLTQDQYDKLEKNRKENGEKMKTLAKELREKRKAFGEALGKTGNESDLKKMHKDIKELTARMADTMFDGMMYIRKVLTPEQAAKFHEMIGRDMKKGGGMMGMRGHDGPGMGPEGRRGMEGRHGGHEGCPGMDGQGKNCRGGEGMTPPAPPDGGEPGEMMPPPGAEDMNDDAECDSCRKQVPETSASKEAKEKK